MSNARPRSIRVQNLCCVVHMCCTIEKGQYRESALELLHSAWKQAVCAPEGGERPSSSRIHM